MIFFFAVIKFIIKFFSEGKQSREIEVTELRALITRATVMKTRYLWNKKCVTNY